MNEQEYAKREALWKYALAILHIQSEFGYVSEKQIQIAITDALSVLENSQPHDILLSTTIIKMKEVVVNPRKKGDSMNADDKEKTDDKTDDKTDYYTGPSTRPWELPSINMRDDEDDDEDEEEEEGATA